MRLTEKELIEFDGFRLDTRNRIIEHDGKPLKLPPKAVETLIILIRSYPEVVSQDTLRQELWPDSVVEDSNLPQNVYVLRKALGSGANGPYIETLPKRGYRFTGQPRVVEWADPVPQVEAEVSPTPAIRIRPRRWIIPVALAALALTVAAAIAVPRWLKHREAYALVEEGFRDVRENRSPKFAEASTRFSRALELEPKLAIGYAGLAEVMVRSGDGSRSHAPEMAQRSLAIDPDCVECRGIAGWIQLTYQWRFGDALRNLQNAARLRPTDPTLQLWNAQALTCTGHLDQALTQINAAIALNPAAAAPQAMRAGILYFMRRYDESLAAGRLALGLNPGHTGALDWIYRSAMASGRVEELMRTRGALVASFDGMSPEWREQRERGYHDAYRAGGIQALVKLLLTESESPIASRVQCYDRATLRVWAGDNQGAIDELEQLFAEHPYHSIYLGVDPIFDPIRNDPRFRAILSRIGL